MQLSESHFYSGKNLYFVATVIVNKNGLPNECSMNNNSIHFGKISKIKVLADLLQ